MRHLLIQSTTLFVSQSSALKNQQKINGFKKINRNFGILNVLAFQICRKILCSFRYKEVISLQSSVQFLNPHSVINLVAIVKQLFVEFLLTSIGDIYHFKFSLVINWICKS